MGRGELCKSSVKESALHNSSLPNENDGQFICPHSVGSIALKSDQ